MTNMAIEMLDFQKKNGDFPGEITSGYLENDEHDWHMMGFPDLFQSLLDGTPDVAGMISHEGRIGPSIYQDQHKLRVSVHRIAQ